MRLKLFKLLSLGLCFSMMAPTLAYAAPMQEQITAEDIDGYNYDVVVPREMAFPEYVVNEDTYEITNISVEESDDAEQRTFLDYFPDPNFAQGIAKILGKNKEDLATISELSKIQSVILEQKNISSIEGIEHLTNLISLNLNNNQIAVIPDSIGELTNLIYLALADNQISVIPDSIEQLTNLEYLYLMFNQISVIPNFIGQLTNLKNLYLRDNQISVIPNSIGQLTDLQTLLLSNNQISVIPNSIGQLTNLQNLYLMNNQISVIPDSIGQLTNLIYSNLSHNQISVIPNSIGQLNNLKSLNLEYNQISVIPDSIGQLANLQTLTIDKNQIAVIPDSIGQLTNLTYLNLSNNRISVIPDSIEQLTNLSFLLFHNNQIISKLPTTLLFTNSWNDLRLQGQNGSLAAVHFTSLNDINYEFLTSPLILQTKENNNGILAGTWQIIDPAGNITTVVGGDGSEITPSLFQMHGKYLITFLWTSLAPYTDIIPSWTHTSSLYFNSRIEIFVGQTTERSHQVTVITRYLDNALPEDTTTYQVEDNASFLESFEVLEGYELYNSALRSLPVFHVDMNEKTVGLNVVNRDYTVVLEFDKTEYKVKLNTSYLDGYLTDTIQTDWIRYQEEYFQIYQIAEGYQIANLEQLPTDIFIDETNHTVAINSVTQDVEIDLKFEKKQYDVTIKIIYEDGSRDDQISTYAVPYGDRFETGFEIEKGYSIKKINFNAIGVSVNRSRQEVTVEKVTAPVEIIIIVR